jgi:hypothetical protein
MATRLKSKKQLVNVVMGIPCHRRLDILKIQSEYHRDVLRPFLLNQGINLTFFMVGTDHVEQESLPIDGITFVYESQPENILTRKFNRLFEFAKERNVDALMVMGSDDFIPPQLFLDMLRIASDNKFISAPSQMLIHDVLPKATYVWKGYSFYAPHRFLGLGQGRVYTKGLINLLPLEPFGTDPKNANCGQSIIDQRIRDAVVSANVDFQKITTSCNNHINAILLSLKVGNTSFNPPSVFLNRKLVEDETIDINDRELFGWLSEPILLKILSL